MIPSRILLLTLPVLLPLLLAPPPGLAQDDDGAGNELDALLQGEVGRSIDEPADPAEVPLPRFSETVDVTATVDDGKRPQRPAKPKPPVARKPKEPAKDGKADADTAEVGEQVALDAVIEELKLHAGKTNDASAKKALDLAKRQPKQFAKMLKEGLFKDEPWHGALNSGGSQAMKALDALSDPGKMSRYVSEKVSGVALKKAAEGVAALEAAIRAIEKGGDEPGKELLDRLEAAKALEEKCRLVGAIADSAKDIMTLVADIEKNWADPTLKNSLSGLKSASDIALTLAKAAEKNPKLKAALARRLPTLWKFFEINPALAKTVNPDSLARALSVAVNLAKTRENAHAFVSANDEYYRSVEGAYAQPFGKIGTVEGFAEDLAAYARIGEKRVDHAAAGRQFATQAVATGVGGSIVVLSGGLAGVVAETGRDIAVTLAGMKAGEIEDAREHNRFVLENFDKAEMGAENFSQRLSGYKNNVPKIDRVRDVVATAVKAGDAESLVKLHGMLAARTDPKSTIRDPVLRHFGPQLDRQVRMGVQALECALDRRMLEIKKARDAATTDRDKVRLNIEGERVIHQWRMLRELMTKQKIEAVR